MTKRAVIVGINDYSIQFPSGNSNLAQCVRDAQSMYHMMVDAFGFDPSQTWIYTDRAASSENIRRALRYMLINSEPGDVACFYYSGHGAQVPTANGTYYEAIVPASGQWISDHDLYVLADQLQPSVVNFTVILDSCYSGGMHNESEGSQCVRSVRFSDDMIQRMLQSMRTRIPCGVCVPSASALQNNVSNVRAPGSGLVICDEDPDQLFVQQAKSTLISGCRFNELSNEDPSLGHGLLTQAFLDLVNQSNFQIDHRTLLERLRTNVQTYFDRLIRPLNMAGNTSQTPQLRGQQNRMEELFLDAWADCR